VQGTARDERMNQRVNPTPAPETREEWQRVVQQAWAAADRPGPAQVEADRVRIRPAPVAHQVQVQQANPVELNQANAPAPPRAPPRLRTPPPDAGRDR
jgi:hypothetical protein